MKTTVTKTIMALALTAMATFFAGCGPDEPDNPTPPTPTTVAVTGVSLNKSSMTLTEGGSETLTATVAPSNATNTGVSWSSSNTGVATVNGGQVTAVKAGTATITVTTADGNKTATCSVTVEAKKVAVTGVKIDPETLELIEGETGTLKATVEPADATDKKVNWTTSSAEVATVADGVVTAVAPGTATIIATTADGGKTVTCAVTVNPKPVPVEGVSVEVEAIEVAEGENASIVVKITPEDASVKDVTFASSDEAVATVDEEGNITAVAPGTATITVTTADGGKTATCEVTVTPKVVPVEGIAFTKDQVSVVEGEKVLLYVSFTPKNATDKRVTWSSSDTGVATIDSKGNVTGVKPGTATITVKTTDGGKTATCVVTVTKKPTPVSGVTINRTSLTLTVGGGAILVATVSPEDATNQKIVWSSSDESVATVDENGEVTAVKKGTAKVTATTEDGGKTATCDVTVTDQPVAATGVTLNKKTLSIYAGEKSQLAATVNPSNATNHEVTWSSSNTSVATVDKAGNVTGVKAGTATITAKTHNGKTATCTVTVNLAFGIYSLDGNKVLSENATENFKFKVESAATNGVVILPYDLRNKAIVPKTSTSSCTVSNTQYAVVQNEGNGWRVRPLKPGIVTVTVKHGGEEHKFKINSTLANYSLKVANSPSFPSIMTCPSSLTLNCLNTPNVKTVYLRLYNEDDKKFLTGELYSVTGTNAYVGCTIAYNSGNRYISVSANKPGSYAKITVKYGTDTYSISREVTIYSAVKLWLSTSRTSYTAVSSSSNNAFTLKLNGTPASQKFYLWYNSTGGNTPTAYYSGTPSSATWQDVSGNKDIVSRSAGFESGQNSNMYIEVSRNYQNKTGFYQFRIKYNDVYGTLTSDLITVNVIN